MMPYASHVTGSGTTVPSAAELNGHSGDNEIGTPDDLFAWLMQRFGLDYDAFASHENTLLPFYSTEDGTWRGYHPPLPGAMMQEVGYRQNGLLYPWRGRRVFWNPPYGRGIFRQAIEKAITERNTVSISVGLVKYDASTYNGWLLRENFHLEYLPRVRYKGMAQGATFPSVLAINRPDYLSKENR